MFKPYDLVHLASPLCSRLRIVEVISRPYPCNEDGTGDTLINVRKVPGEPTTLAMVRIEQIQTLPSGCQANHQRRWVHVARVNSRIRAFPGDMLRYDGCELFDYNDTDEIPRIALRDELGVLVYQVINREQPRWTFARWQSFGATLMAVGSRDLRVPDQPFVKVK